MKRIFILLFLVPNFAATLIFAQDYSRKSGKVSDYELKMTTYAEDTSAAAVVLYETTTINYNISPSAGARYPITQNIYYYVKYKVLKQEGVDIADKAIRYYHTSSYKETVSGISAVSYNLSYL
jgi:hypothetical protein